jgi:hypothetical protein
MIYRNLRRRVDKAAARIYVILKQVKSVDWTLA